MLASALKNPPNMPLFRRNQGRECHGAGWHQGSKSGDEYAQDRFGLATLGILGALAATVPAQAHDHDGDGWHRRAWHEHEWREHEWHEWREHAWHRYPPTVTYVAPGYYAAPPAYYAPPPVYYAPPPPSVYPTPGVSVGVGFNFR
jgi:hypothetical protein